MVILGPEVSGLYIRVVARENLHMVASSIIVTMTIIKEQLQLPTIIFHFVNNYQYRMDIR